jgi:hypothetical protein
MEKEIEYRVENIAAKNFSDEKSVKEIKDFLSQVGSEGWELMTVLPTNQFEESAFTGKRIIMKNCLLVFKKLK